MIDWINGDVFGFAVERKEIGRPGGKPYYPLAPDGTGRLHTTEGSTVAGAFAALADTRDAPHVIIGERRIIQCRPLNVQAAALHGGPVNCNKGPIQIEMVACSKQELWLPEPGTLDPVVAFIAWCSANLEIPLAVPYDWPDDLSDCSRPLAAHNTRRQRFEADWPSIPKGWYMHLETGWQGPTWHWDCGAIQRSEMIQRARGFIVPGQ